MKDRIKTYSDWLNESMIDKIKDLFKTKKEVEKNPGNETETKMFGIKMDERVKAKIYEIYDYISDVLDDDEKRVGWLNDVNLLYELMKEYDMGEGSSYDMLFAAWVRNNDNLTAQEQLFLLDTFLKQIKLISDFNKNIPVIDKGNFDVFKTWVIAHDKGAKGQIAGLKYGL